MSEKNNTNSWVIITGVIGAIAALLAALGGNQGFLKALMAFLYPNPTSIPTTLPTTLPEEPTPFSSSSPLVILLDNSGSMGICSITRKEDGNDICIPNAEKPYKIDVVKKAILHRLDASNSIADLGSTRIGLVEFGNWQSYGSLGTPKPIPSDANSRFKCEAVKVLVQPELNNHQKLINVLSGNTITANDSGVTPLGFAINSVIYDVLEPKKLLPARILLVTDGKPNCTDEHKFRFCNIVASLKEQGVELTIDIIGYKASSIDQSTGQKNDKEFDDCAKKYSTVVRYLGSKDTLSELSTVVDRLMSYSN